MPTVSVPKDVWTTIVTASADTIIENLGHSEVFITTEAPTLGVFDSKKLTITTIEAGQTARVFSAGKPTNVRIVAPYVTQNILGTVSQSGGVPTGALIERGSSSNGTYIRFADGLQICTRTIEPAFFGSISSVTAVGGFNRSPEYTMTYPALFAAGSQPAVAVGATFDDGLIATARGTVTDWRVFLMRVTSFSSIAVSRMELLAIGRWF
jgi:hypothetical protein